jgi:hypothetical protein
MSTFTSGETSPQIWHHFIVQFSSALFVLLATAWAIIILGDPYDTGRLISRDVSGVVDESPRTADASRGRDPVFDSAIIGNSRGQLLDPKRLSQGTGVNFVQLTIPGTGHREQLAVLRWFVSHHDHIGALVFVTDSVWCTQEASPPLMNAFPFWLYDESNTEYLAGVFRTHTFTLAWRRLLLWTGLRKRSAPDGYWDYESGKTWNFHPEIPARFQPASLQARAPELPFPAIAQLQAALRGLDADVPIALVTPPSFFTDLPPLGDPQSDWIGQCKGALAKLVRQRRRGAFLDFAVDSELTRSPQNFMDAMHYRAPVARLMEHAIVSALAPW